MEIRLKKELIFSRRIALGMKFTNPTTKVVEKEVVGYNSYILPLIGKEYEQVGHQY